MPTWSFHNFSQLKFAKSTIQLIHLNNGPSFLMESTKIMHQFAEIYGEFSLVLQIQNVLEQWSKSIVYI